MSTTLPTSSSLPIPLTVDACYRLSVEKYHEMVRTGLIGEDEPVELLDGVLVKQMGKRSPLRVVKKLLLDALSKMIPGGWYVDEWKLAP